MSMPGRLHGLTLCAVAAWLALASLQAGAQQRTAAANPQGPGGPPNALQGFSQNRNQPVAIESTSLEVRDKDKMATFSGNVKLVQGDTTMYCKTMVVFYEQGAGGAGPKTAQPGPGGNQQIKRIEAKGNVKVIQKDQVATGDNGVYDTATNKVTLLGNVAITQGPQVVKGDALAVDLETGHSRVECRSSNCRVQALIVPGSKDNPLGPHSGQPGQANQGGPAAPGQANQPGQGSRPATRGTGAASPLRPQGLQ
jgi:lipopolysaccharide export system protein LptA